jgi:hypothetical protein
VANPNPNEPSYPYSGGTDNPGDDTSRAGGGVMVETGIPGAALLHPGLPTTIAAGGTDTILPAGAQAVPATGAGWESSAEYGGERSADPEGGIDPVTGAPREAGQDETQGATETTSGQAPAAFPEPTP